MILGENETTMVIDMHVHLADKRIYPEYWLEGLKDSVAQSVKRQSSITVSDEFLRGMMDKLLCDFDCSRMIASMDQAGIDKANVLLSDFGYGEEEYKLDIEQLYKIHYKAYQQYPDRISVFAGIDPRRGKKGLDIFEKGIKEYGFCGLKIYPPCGFEIDDKRLFPFYELCDYYCIPVLAHIGASLPTMKKTFDYPNSVLRVTSEFKRFLFILGHAALLYYEESHLLPLKCERIFLETSGFQTAHLDSTELEARIKGLFKTCGHNILFGSDWPMFTNQKEVVNYFKEHKIITEAQKEMLLYKNALSLFSN